MGGVCAPVAAARDCCVLPATPTENLSYSSQRQFAPLECSVRHTRLKTGHSAVFLFWAK